MSVILMGKIWRADLPAMDKIVLLKMADCAHDDGQAVWPSNETVAKECGCSERHVRNVLKAYRGTGLLKVAAYENTVRKTREYAFDLEKLEGIQIPTPAPRSGVPRHPVPPTPAPGAPKPLVNHQSNHPKKDTPSPVSTTEPLSDRNLPTHRLADAEKTAPSPTVVELKPNGKKYAWQGETFRLTVKDWRVWKRRYWAIGDLQCMLDRVDEYYAHNPDKRKTNMMFAYSNWLNNEHDKLVKRGAVMPQWLRLERQNAE